MSTTRKNKKSTNAKDLLKSLAASKSTDEEEKPANKPSHPVMDLNPTEQEKFKNFAEAQVLFKDVESHMKATKEEVNRFGFDKWLEIMWASKSRPSTHVMQALDDNGAVYATANFIVAEKPKFNIPKKEKGETLEDAFARTIMELLVSTGMEEEEAEDAAEEIVDELDLDERGYIDFFRWSSGRYVGEGPNKEFKPASNEDQALAQKMIDILQEHLTKEEFEKVLEFEKNISLRKGFFERVCRYVKSKQQLEKIVSIIAPTYYPNQVKICVSSSNREQDEKNRKYIVAKEIIETGRPK